MWFPKIKKIQKLNLLKSGLNGGQKGILFFVHVNMNVSRIILILVANWQEIFGEWLINPRPQTESSEVTLINDTSKVLFKSQSKRSHLYLIHIEYLVDLKDVHIHLKDRSHESN